MVYFLASGATWRDKYKMGDKKLSDWTSSDLSWFMLKVLAGLLSFIGIIVLIAWLTG